MYSGTTLTAYSGRMLGAHQKIDRAARRNLERLVPKSSFPKSKAILHFEGDNGPDAIKRKSPAKDEPWHYFQPFDGNDTQLLKLIERHYNNLVKALKACDSVRASFEAAWVSHAMVDGLTPAHHFPYEERLVELMNGKSIHTRTSFKDKVVMPGENARVQIGNNWKMWGPKGLFLTHTAFEWGVSMLLAPMKLSNKLIHNEKLKLFEEKTLADWYRLQAQVVANMHLYDDFYKTGWTIPLARSVRKELAPVLVETVTLVWYGAVRDAGLAEAA